MNKHGVGISNILKGVKEGEDITTLEVAYYDKGKRAFTNRERGVADNNMMFIVYKDKDNHKRIQQIADPKMRIYFVNPEERTFRTPREYIEIDKCYHKDVTPSSIIGTIVNEIKKSDDPVSKSMLNMYQYAKTSTIKGATKEVLKWPFTLMSDIDIESYYRIMLGYHYNQMRGHVIDKCFLDIESDIFGLTSTETNMNMDKTNACTLIFRFDEHGPRKDWKTQVYTLLMRDYDRYPQQEAFENNLDKFYDACHEAFDKQTVIKDGKKKVIDCDADYHILMFDDEEKLLTNIFKIINAIRPDTCEIWNIAYDIPKLYARLEANGYDPIDVMSDPAWPEQYRWVDIDIDNRPIDIAERKTSVRMSSTTLYYDQMQTYAGIRKGRKAYGSTRLDNIAKIELGMGKWTFGPGIDVTNACIKDYWNFVLYNIRDVWCQVLIDQVTNDTTAVVYDMNQSFCPLKAIFKQITYQRQIYYTQRLNRGFLSGNNPNVDYIKGESEEMLERLEDIKRAREQRRRFDSEDDEQSDAEDRDDDDTEIDTEENEVVQGVIETEAFDPYWDDPTRDLKLQGGMVGDPDNNIANGTELIKGVKSKHIFDDVLDMDFASEYPWAKVTRSLSKSTQFGRLIIPERISKRQNVLPLGQQKRQEDQKYYTSSAEFIGDYISNDIISFGNVWFGLPTINELQERLNKEKKGDL